MWGQFCQQFSQGSSAWGAIFVLLSTKAHAGFDWLNPIQPGGSRPQSEAGQGRAGGNSNSSDGSQAKLLQRMLDNTPTGQLPAVQQRVLSVLCTAAKVCLSAEGDMQVCQVTEAYRCMIQMAWSVLPRLLQPQAAPTGNNAAAAPAGEGSSSTSSSAANSSSKGSGGSVQEVTVAASMGQQNPVSGPPGHADVALSWLSLLGRCFLQASQSINQSMLHL
jgi:hypothetical protein